jgi:hypothetical protein
MLAIEMSQCRRSQNIWGKHTGAEGLVCLPVGLAAVWRLAFSGIVFLGSESANWMRIGKIATQLGMDAYVFIWYDHFSLTIAVVARGTRCEVLIFRIYSEFFYWTLKRRQWFSQSILKIVAICLRVAMLSARCVGPLDRPCLADYTHFVASWWRPMFSRN